MLNQLLNINPQVGGVIEPPSQANIVEWWRADSGVTVINPGVDNRLVSYTGKKNSLVLVPGSTASAPVINLTGYFGKPCIDFIPSNDYLRNLSFATIAQPFTVCLIWKNANTAGVTYPFNSNGSTYFQRFGTTENYTAGNIQAFGTADLNYHVYQFNVNGASSVIYKDGSPVFSGDLGAGSINTSIYLGAFAAGSGNAAGCTPEFIIYNANINATDYYNYTQAWKTS